MREKGIYGKSMADDFRRKRIVVTGWGVVTPIGIGREAFAGALRAGVSGAGPITLFDAAAYTSRFACEVKGFKPEEHLDRKKARRMDRFCQFAVVAARMAMEHSGLDPAKEDCTRIGVILGSGIGGLRTIEDEHTELITKGPGRVSPFMIPMQIANIAAGEIAMLYGFNGPNYAIASACASANHAIGDALRMLRYGDADVIIAGGAEAAITPIGLAGFCSLKALSQRNDEPARASRPFDLNRDGFVMGEGAGMFVLETWEHAMARGARIHAELAGYGATDDAYHMTAPREDGAMQALCITRALEDAGVNPDDIDYVNAHGTSTEFNDKFETIAIKKALGEHALQIPVNSTKSMTGHLLGAAGAVELAAIIVQMAGGFVHPTINYETPDPACDLDYVPNAAREKRIHVAISNNFGFGGHNAVLVVRRAD